GRSALGAQAPRGGRSAGAGAAGAPTGTAAPSAASAPAASEGNCAHERHDQDQPDARPKATRPITKHAPTAENWFFHGRRVSLKSLTPDKQKCRDRLLRKGQIAGPRPARKQRARSRSCLDLRGSVAFMANESSRPR